MHISKKEIRHIADLSGLKIVRRRIGSRRIKYVQKDFKDFLKKCKDLSVIDTTNIEPTFYPLPIQNVFHEDIAKPSLSVNEALSNAPAKENNYFVVPKILQY